MEEDIYAKMARVRAAKVNKKRKREAASLMSEEDTGRVDKIRATVTTDQRTGTMKISDMVPLYEQRLVNVHYTPPTPIKVPANTKARQQSNYDDDDDDAEEQASGDTDRSEDHDVVMKDKKAVDLGRHNHIRAKKQGIVASIVHAFNDSTPSITTAVASAAGKVAVGVLGAYVLSKLSNSNNRSEPVQSHPQQKSSLFFI